MAEEFNPEKEGCRIASAYLSKRGWAREWRSTINRQLYAEFQRDELENKERQCDRMEEEAEEYFNAEYERWKEDREVCRAIFAMLGRRSDLGFFARQIVARLKREFASP